jgi:DeoR/GlpR family transcriptional regulator of sugar metabolism
VLEEMGVLKRVYGGAVRLSINQNPYLFHDEDIGLHQGKEAIAREAVKLIGPEDTILLDMAQRHCTSPRT